MTNETPPMTPQEFYALVDAYGAEERRWPKERRAAAGRFAETPEGAAYLQKAAGLDAILSRYQAPSPSPSLVARVLPPEALAAASRRATWQRRLRASWMGAGLVGLGLAGGLTGAVAVSVIMPGQPLPFSDGVVPAALTLGTAGTAETAFGTIDGEPAGETNGMIGTMQ
ncbi:hypothetical protein J2858_000538 [Neorhizobium galegae]|uniref:hypothetical protein n=1 Tax=Neorhizobium galegae TaxID=399 RepID=UPI001AE35EB1|nr:hypothetical protein [Neorhizobium galegae]MBP2547645.1 hypothetical protein [Neorhizobium galegae]